MSDGLPMDSPREACGVFGIAAADMDVAKATFYALYALQHRGQESAGIAVSDGRRLAVRKGMGLVSQIFDEENLQGLSGTMAIGHNRYSTKGSSSLPNTQPFTLETFAGPLAIGHNGNLINAGTLRTALLEEGAGFNTATDSEVILMSLARRARLPWLENFRLLMEEAEGAYTLVVLTQDGIFGVRDPWGLRPLALGRRGESYMLASESCAFAPVGASLVCEIAPGQVVRIRPGGYEIEQVVPPRRQAFCTFEEIYFARPDSIFADRLVHQSRQALGRQLALEAPADADWVMSVPDSGTPHAIGYARETGIPYTEGLTKSRYIGRTFIQPSDELRRTGIAMKFNPLGDNLTGQRVVLVDDSIVRGNTAGPLVALIRNGGAAEVHLRVACPPILHPCFMGVDMASREELIAARHDFEGIRRQVGADSLAYLSLEGMRTALSGTAAHEYCDACFTGTYPFESVTAASIDGEIKLELASVFA